MPEPEKESQPTSTPPSVDSVPEDVMGISLVVHRTLPESIMPSIEARQAFYDALKREATAEYSNLIRVAHSKNFVDALDHFPRWFAQHGLKFRPGFDAAVFRNDAFNSFHYAAKREEPFRLLAFPWSPQGEDPAVEIACRVWHPMVRTLSNEPTAASVKTWSKAALLSSAVELFRARLSVELDAVYKDAKSAGVIPKQARKLELAMQRLVRKQVLRYSTADIVELEAGTTPPRLDSANSKHINESAVRAVDKSIDAAAERLGLEVVRLRAGPKPGRRASG